MTKKENKDILEEIKEGNEKLLNSLEDIHNDINIMNEENIKTKRIGFVAVALAFIAISTPLMIELTNPPKIYLWLVAIVYFLFGIIILVFGYKIK